MISFALVQTGFYLGMAGQAFGIRHPVSQVVALGAVRESFEMGVNGGQRAW